MYCAISPTIDWPKLSLNNSNTLWALMKPQKYIICDNNIFTKNKKIWIHKKCINIKTQFQSLELRTRKGSLLYESTNTTKVPSSPHSLLVLRCYPYRFHWSYLDKFHWVRMFSFIPLRTINIKPLKNCYFFNQKCYVAYKFQVTIIIPLSKQIPEITESREIHQRKLRNKNNE